MTPQELLESYQKATGMRVSLSYVREQMLSDLLSRDIGEPITSEEVVAVLKEIKRRVDIGQKGYTQSSLEFRNAMVPDTMEERILSMRQRKERLKPKPVQVPTVINVGQDSIHVLDDPVPEEPKRADIARALHGLARDMEKAS